MSLNAGGGQGGACSVQTEYKKLFFPLRTSCLVNERWSSLLMFHLWLHEGFVQPTNNWPSGTFKHLQVVNKLKLEQGRQRSVLKNPRPVSTKHILCNLSLFSVAPAFHRTQRRPVWETMGHGHTQFTQVGQTHKQISRDEVTCSHSERQTKQQRHAPRLPVTS